MTAKDVYEIIITPMVTTYPVLTHLRGDQSAQAKVLEMYVRALERFGAETLVRAWDKVTGEHTLWCWPPVGKFVEAARLFAPRTLPPSDEEQRRQRAREMSEAYASRYMKTSRLARLARPEGWAGQLRYYVAACAWVQAQMISGVKSISWDTTILSPADRSAKSKDAFAAYRKRIEGVVSRGDIQVRVPQDRIKAWKAQAADDRASHFSQNPGTIGGR